MPIDRLQLDIFNGDYSAGTVHNDARVAIVHDWLNGMRGGEKVLEQICRLFPQADIHTLIYEKSKVSPEIRNHQVIPSQFNSRPLFRKNYRWFLPLLPKVIERMNLRDYDLVISSSHCVAKGILPPPNGIHLSYVHSPMRYIWDHFEDYLSGNPLKDLGLRAFRKQLQRWDIASTDRVDGISCNSAHIAEKIKIHWKRKATVIPPPVELEKFRPNNRRPDDFFLVVSALVPYKKIERAIAAAKIAHQNLVIIGDGPERSNLIRLSNEKVLFLGWLGFSKLLNYYQRCKALIFPGTEDFGITALEAQACGRPVLAYNAGGVRESVIADVTGQFFDHPDPNSLAILMKTYQDSDWNSRRIHEHAQQFSPENFRKRFAIWVEKEVKRFS